MERRWIGVSAVSGFLAVALGAFGAHVLKAKLSPQMMAVYHTANQYQFYHTLALMLIGLLALHWPESRRLNQAGWLMSTGILLFSGSLYVLAVSGIKIIGIITPIGGVLLLAGWLFILLACCKKQAI
ncbi:DUF423 domain-containing protein [Dongshaea marina]|uniref:DUF423 domain-containing protein n=1 Tax=Dongshaea marina TaxID=2047966 RepID=UPI000D3EC8AE|nr:DUF423 domain-containing protein [Dongshaea marina]